VSCSALKSLESTVAAVFRSIDAPQEEQNRPVEETCAPQEGQYMGRRDSTIEVSHAAIAKDDHEKCDGELRNALDLDGSAVGQHFGHTLHHFRGVVAQSDNGVRAMLAGMLEK